MVSVDTKAIKIIMIEQGFDSITQLAKATGISRNTLTYAINGKTKPSAYVMNKIIEALSIPPETAGKIFFGGNLRIT